jgi:uncharacterized membrane-anchored protein YhcB (DUF1043 family)
MPDIFSVLVANGATWGVTLTLIIAGLIVSAVLLYRYIVRLDEEFQKLTVELESVKEKVDDKVSAIYDRLNAIASDVAFIKGRMEGEK